jgi:hypothetical protein
MEEAFVGGDPLPLPFRIRAAGKAFGWRMASPDPVDVAECFAPTKATVHQHHFIPNERRLAPWNYS